MIYNTDSFIKDLETIGVPFDSPQVQAFIKYYELLIKWNDDINLTAIVDFDEVILKHFTDSLFLLKYYDIPKGAKVVDVGTGAGFPGIPLKIMRPDIEILLLDSLNKRINFLKAVVNELGLTNVSCLHGRAEELGLNLSYREQYDVCVSRAVASLSVLSEYCLPFVKPGGLFISYKSSDIDEEKKAAAKAVSLMSGSFAKEYVFTLPDSDINRSFIFIKKTGPLDERYPRRSSQIKNKPL